MFCGLRLLSLGSLCVLALQLALAIALTGCDEEPAIALYPVELLDPAARDPLDTDPLFAPTPLVCTDCVERDVVLPGGDVARIRGEREPSLRLVEDEIAFLELADHEGSRGAADGETANVERFGVYAVLDGEGQEAWSELATRYSRHFVLVEIGGRAVDLVRPLGWSRGLRIGVFENEAARDAYVRGLPFASKSRP